MENIFKYHAIAVTESAEVFCARHAHPFLVKYPPNALQTPRGSASIAAGLPSFARSYGDDEKTARTIVTSGTGEDAPTSLWLVAPLVASRKNVAPDEVVLTADLPIVAGRSRSHDVVLRFRSISHTHASLYVLSPTTVDIVDESSTNGTFVNHRRLAPGVRERAQVGDHVRFGQFSMTLLDASGFYTLLLRIPSPAK